MKAFELFQAAAMEGHAKAQYWLAASYFDGAGTQKDLAKAFEWFEKSAAQGHAQGQLSLGLMHHNGFGTPKDRPKPSSF